MKAPNILLNKTPFFSFRRLLPKIINGGIAGKVNGCLDDTLHELIMYFDLTFRYYRCIMRFSSRFGENTSAKSTGWAKWRKNVQKHVSKQNQLIECAKISSIQPHELKLLAHKNSPMHFHGLMASTRCIPGKDDRFHFVCDIFIFVSMP
jgi:hypothetical protein